MKSKESYGIYEILWYNVIKRSLMTCARISVLHYGIMSLDKAKYRMALRCALLNK